MYKYNFMQVRWEKCMRRFCIITNQHKDNALSITCEVERYLKEFNCECFRAEKSAEGGYTDATGIPEGTDCAIVLGTVTT